jgi:hypothetical protein
MLHVTILRLTFGIIFRMSFDTAGLGIQKRP